MYSFGLCLLELATLEYPYAECRNPAQVGHDNHDHASDSTECPSHPDGGQSREISLVEGLWQN